MHYEMVIRLLERARILFIYYLNSGTLYQIHSPYLNQFIDFVFHRKRLYYHFIEIEKEIQLIRANDFIIPGDHFSIHHRQAGLTIAQMFAKAGHSRYDYECLYRLILNCKPEKILELGSNLGMSGLSMALAAKKARIQCIEGNSFFVSFCNKLFEKFKLKSADCLAMTFREYLKHTEDRDFDLVFLDGDHVYSHTMEYLDYILRITTDKAIIVMDDIHWSLDMYKAWNQIIRNPAIHCSLETLRWGFLFKDQSLTKGNFSYIEARLKPWRILF